MCKFIFDAISIHLFGNKFEFPTDLFSRLLTIYLLLRHIFTTEINFASLFNVTLYRLCTSITARKMYNTRIREIPHTSTRLLPHS